MEKRLLALEPDADRAQRILEKHPEAIIAKSADDAIFHLSRGKFDVLLIKQYTGLEGNEDEELFDSYEEFEARDCSGKLVNWITIFFPVIKRVWIHGKDFGEIALHRQMLNSSGYSSMYMPFDNFLTFTSV